MPSRLAIPTWEQVAAVIDGEFEKATVGDTSPADAWWRENPTLDTYRDLFERLNHPEERGDRGDRQEEAGDQQRVDPPPPALTDRTTGGLDRCRGRRHPVAVVRRADRGKYTLPVALAHYAIGQNNTRFGLPMAGAVVINIPVLIIFGFCSATLSRASP